MRSPHARLRLLLGALGGAAAVSVGVACGSDYTEAPVPGEPVFIDDEAAAPRDSAAPVIGIDASDADAAEAAPVITLCDPGAPFTTVTAMPGAVNTASDDSFPTLTDDELTIYFQRSPVGGGNPTFFVAQRATTSADFGPPVEVSELADGRFNSFPAVTAKGDLLFFGSDSDIRVAKSVSVGRFGVAMPVPAMSGAESENFPALFGMGEELWASVSGDAGAIHFRRSVRLADGGFGVPQSVPELDSTGYESGLASSRDGLTIYFGSPRAGTLGGGDIFTARRQTRNAPFGSITPLPAPVSSPFDDGPGWLSADNCRLYFTTTRLGTFDIYVASRPKP